MGITEYARHRNCGLAAVQYAVKAGRIHRNPDGLIESDRADAEWEQNTLHTNARYGQKGIPKKASADEAAAATGHIQAGRHRAATHAAKAAAAETADALDSERRQITAADFNKSRAARELYEAKLTKLKYEERRGKLVSKDDIEREVFNAFRVLRDAAFNIPDRIAAQLAAESETAMVFEILHREIALVFEQFASGKNEEAAA
jgi:hypothetical protein